MDVEISFVLDSPAGLGSFSLVLALLTMEQRHEDLDNRILSQLGCGTFALSWVMGR